MIPNQIIEIKVKSNKTLFYYNKKGYSLEKNSGVNTITVNSKDLPKSSQVKINYQCDICGKIGSSPYFSLLNKKEHLCRSCAHKGKEPANKIHLSPYEIDFIERSYSEEWISPREIGKYIGYSEPVIYRALKEKGYPINRRGKKPNKTCPICKKQFKVIPSEIKDVNCCSKKCRGIYSRKRISLTCLYCHKVFQVKPHQHERKFCSLKCGNEYSKKGKVTSCKICGKQIWSTPSRPLIFCSKECFGKSNITGKIIDCAYCGSSRYVPKSHLRNELYFCSHECSIKYRQIDDDYYARILDKSRKSHLKKWNEDIVWAKKRRMEASINAIKMLKRFNRGTSSIEKTIYNLLKDLSINYIPQKEIVSNNYSVKKVYDVYLPNTNTFIEIHGSFWHADPRFYYDVAKLKPVQIKNLHNDKIKKDIVENELNKKLFILWEHDILTNIEGIKNKLLEWNNVKSL